MARRAHRPRHPQQANVHIWPPRLEPRNQHRYHTRICREGSNGGGVGGRRECDLQNQKNDFVTSLMSSYKKFS